MTAHYFYPIQTQESKQNNLINIQVNIQGNKVKDI